VIPTVSDFFSKLFRWHSPEDLRWHLATLVFVVLLPALIFSTLVVLFVLRLEREAGERGVKETARAVALSVDRELASAISALKVLATSDHLTPRGFWGFLRAGEVRDHQRRPLDRSFR
jgi:H+/Cl- antiporter ClcA